MPSVNRVAIGLCVIMCWMKYLSPKNEQSGLRSAVTMVLLHIGLQKDFPGKIAHVRFQPGIGFVVSETISLPDRAIIWQASVECIKLPNNDLSGFFDFVSCLDVTEHLPPLVYKAMIEELWRVLKPNGHLILMQGNAPNVEHIHVLPENELVTDFVNFGFGLIKICLTVITF